MINIRGQRLSSIDTGQTATLQRVLEDENSDLLRYLAEIGLLPGARVTVVNVAPFDGPLTLLIDGSEKVVGRKVASTVLVEAD